MSMHAQARSAYASAVKPHRTARGIEHEICARVPHRMSAADETARSDFPVLAAAVFDNQRLWPAPAEDLMHDGDVLLVPLHAQLIGVAEFVRKHSQRVLGGNGSAAPRIDFNTAVWRLRGAGEGGA